MATLRHQPEQSRCDVYNGTRGPLPRVPFCTIAKDILGPRFAVSVALLGDRRSRALNLEFRKKSYVPNVLSFQTGKTTGEIILNPRKARQEAKQYGHTEREHLLYLFVHACLHLKGHDHSTRMDALEQKYFQKHLKDS